MNGAAPVTTVRTPSACTPGELQDFVAFVLAGGEVTPVGFPDRVARAHSLAFLRNGECLLGVAGLKIPSQNHRSEVAAGSGVSIKAKSFPLELGWVFVLPSARGGKSYPLCAPLVQAAGSQGIFATSRSGNPAMHSTLGKLGFSRAGGQWQSGQSKDKLWLFVKHAVQHVDQHGHATAGSRFAASVVFWSAPTLIWLLSIGVWLLRSKADIERPLQLQSPTPPPCNSTSSARHPPPRSRR